MMFSSEMVFLLYKSFLFAQKWLNICCSVHVCLRVIARFFFFFRKKNFFWQTQAHHICTSRRVNKLHSILTCTDNTRRQKQEKSRAK